MSESQRLPLDASGKKCWAMKDFTFHGRRYARGDRFDWRKLSCSVRQAQRLHENRFITSGDVELKEAPAPKAKPKPRAAAPSPEPAQEQPEGESQEDSAE